MSIILKKIKRKIFPKSLYARALTIIIVPILLMQLIVGFVFIDRPWDNMVDKLVYSLAGEVKTLVAHLDNNDIDNEYIIKQARQNLNTSITIDKYKDINKDVDNETLGFAWKRIENKILEEFFQHLDRDFNLITLPETEEFEVNVKLANNKVATLTFSNKKIASPTTYIFILWLIGTSILLMVVAVIFMKNQVKPIRRLAEAAEKLGKGQNVEYFKIEGASEVRQASRAFLDMRSRITRQIEQRTAMLAGVSHDIKTPITRIKLQLAMMNECKDIELIKQDLQEMEAMLGGYLSFARGEGDEKTELVDVKSIVHRIIEKAAREGHHVEEISPHDKVEIQLRPNAIERAISNIVGNACKYAGHVWVNLEKHRYAIQIIIEDDGKGIAEDKREDVFKPFFRVEKSRNLKTGGVGLGLSVARDIVHSHGGEIKLLDSDYGGLKVLIRLPL